MGGTNVFFSEEGKYFGFVMNEENREPISGSLKRSRNGHVKMELEV